MSFVAVLVVKMLIAVSAVQEPQSQAATGDAFAAELIAHADATLAKEGVKLSGEDRKELYSRIRAAVGTVSQLSAEEQARLRSQLELTLRIMIGAVRRPELASLAIETGTFEKVPVNRPGGFGIGALTLACFPTKTFDQLTAQASKIALTDAADSSRLNIVLTALFASALEAKLKPTAKPRQGETCVDLEDLEALQRELQRLLSQPVPSQAPLAPSVKGATGVAPPAAVPLAATATPSTTTTGPSQAPKGIVNRVLRTLCSYPFCL